MGLSLSPADMTNARRAFETNQAIKRAIIDGWLGKTPKPRIKPYRARGYGPREHMQFTALFRHGEDIPVVAYSTHEGLMARLAEAFRRY